MASFQLSAGFGRNMIDCLILRLEFLCNTLLGKASEGEPGFEKMVQDGHVAHYRNEINFIKGHGKEWV